MPRPAPIEPRILPWMLAALLAPAHGAWAEPPLPSPSNSTVPGAIALIGTTGGVPASGTAQFTVVARDLASQPMTGVAVVVDLSGCTALQICADQHDSAVVVNCAAKTVRKLTHSRREATITVLGRSLGGAATTVVHGGLGYGNGL